MGRLESDMVTYTGQFYNCKDIHGEGTIKSKKHQCSWTGKFNMSKFDGKGILTLKDGTTKQVTFPKDKEAYGKKPDGNVKGAVNVFEDWVS